MKIIKRIAAFALAAAMLLGICASMTSCKERGNIVASYDGGEIYEGDLVDWQSYFLGFYYQNIIKSENPTAEIQQVLDLTTKAVLQTKIFKDILEKEDILVLKDSDIKQRANEIIEELNEDEELKKLGGYDHWKKYYGVSKNFIYDYAEYVMITECIESYIMSREENKITDEDVRDYWNKNASEFLITPSYILDVIIVVVENSKLGDPAAWESAKAEAQGYLDRLKNGEKYDDVKIAALQNTVDTDIFNAYSVRDRLAISDCEGFEDIDRLLAEAKEVLDGFAEESKIELVEYPDITNENEYRLWFDNVNIHNEIYVKNAILNMEVGDCVSEPIKFINGYEIFRYAEKDENLMFQTPEVNDEVYQRCYDAVYDERWDAGAGPAVTSFEEKMYKDYNVDIKFSYVDAYNGTT